MIRYEWVLDGVIIVEILGLAACIVWAFWLVVHMDDWRYKK